MHGIASTYAQQLAHEVYFCDASSTPLSMRQALSPQPCLYRKPVPAWSVGVMSPPRRDTSTDLHLVCTSGLNSTRTAVVASRHLQNSSAARLSAEHQQRQERQTRLLAPTEAHTTRLAQLLAADYRQGDCICLHGDVGAGKSFFR
jgi:hypothetical protein